MATTTPTPYLKLGRGGAGNYLTPTTQPLQPAANSSLSLSPAAADIESQPPAQPALTTTTTTTAAAKGEQAAATAEYAHSGRGGAGNWFSPRELDATGTFASIAPSPSSSSWLGTAAGSTSCSSTATAVNDVGAFQPAAAPAPASASSVAVAGPAYYGRGGAGNFNAGFVEEGRRGRRVEEEEEREQEKERRREEVGEMVRREVERGLRRPEGAYLRGGGGRAVDVEEV